MWPRGIKKEALELEADPNAWQPILEAAWQGNVTLLYSAVLLKAFLEEQVNG